MKKGSIVEALTKEIEESDKSPNFVGVIGENGKLKFYYDEK